MSILTRTLMAMILLRLLMPPGICICHQTAPAAFLLARVLDRPTPDPISDDEDHNSAVALMEYLHELEALTQSE